MPYTAIYSATMRTRTTTSAANAKPSQASQEYYDDSMNYVGIVHFAGMAMSGKVIKEIGLEVTSAKAGYSASMQKTVYVRKSNYQSASQAGITGTEYFGDELGTFTGSFYNNETYVELEGELLANMAAYLSAGNNTICLYNPSPVKSVQGYSMNYLQWNTCSIVVVYDEGASKPTLSAATVDMGESIIISTNRQNSNATHTLRYSFGSVSEEIAADVTDTYTWAPPLTLAEQIPNATSGRGTLYCDTYVDGKFIATVTCPFTLNVPASIVPVISEVSVSEAVAGIADRFGGYLRTRSKLSVSITASGTQGSTISAYRTTLDGVTYTASAFISNTLNTAGDLVLTTTITDSRGRSTTVSRTITVLDYSPPSLSVFTAERCNSDGTSVQTDGSNVRITAKVNAASVAGKNSMNCTISFRVSGTETWTVSTTLTPVDYVISENNLLLAQTFDALHSYDIKLSIQDAFYTVEQVVSIGTKQVMMDFYRDGSGIAFGKVAETPGKVEFGWPLALSSPLSVSQGGTGADTEAGACDALGALRKTGDTMTGTLQITGTEPTLLLTPEGSEHQAVLSGGTNGEAILASHEDTSGNNARCLMVQNAAHESSMDLALLLRSSVDGTWTDYRLFHAGMQTPIPLANGGTGGTDAASARKSLGTSNAENLTSGTIPAGRLPFKIAYGSASISGKAATAIDYADAGFTQAPCICVTYSSPAANWAGDNGAIKVYSKTTTDANLIVGGTFNTARAVDWIAIGI